MKQIIPSNWKNCATCARWGGARKPADPYLNNVEFDNNEKGKCYGGGFNQLMMPSMATCGKWEQQYEK